LLDSLLQEILDLYVNFCVRSEDKMFG